MNTLKTGRIYGFAFGMIGVFVCFFIYLILVDFRLETPNKQEIIDAFVVLLVFSFLSIYFGERAARRIVDEDKNAYYEGGLSSIFTLASTVIICVPLTMIIHVYLLGHAFWNIPMMIFITLPFTLVFGGIPAVIIGAIFGHVIKKKLVLDN